MAVFRPDERYRCDLGVMRSAGARTATSAASLRQGKPAHAGFDPSGLDALWGTGPALPSVVSGTAGHDGTGGRGASGVSSRYGTPLGMRRCIFQRDRTVAFGSSLGRPPAAYLARLLRDAARPTGELVASAKFGGGRFHRA